MNTVLLSLCRHCCSIMDGWVPYPSTCIARSTKIDLKSVRKELRKLKQAGLIYSDLYVETGEDLDRPILVRGYLVTDQCKDTEEYRTAWAEEREIVNKCFNLDIGPVDNYSKIAAEFEKELDTV